VAFPSGLIFVIDLIAIFAIYLAIALSLNLEFGYAGIPNFGKVLVVAGGAFVVGFFPGRIAVGLLGVRSGLDYIAYNRLIIADVNSVLATNLGLSLTLLFGTLIIAGIIGAVLGFVASYPAIRLREDYLAMMLLAVGRTSEL